MSGIAGLLSLIDVPIGHQSLERAATYLTPYGPDGSGVWRDDRIILAHYLTRVAPNSHFENQPYTRQNLTLVADARLDNRQELCRLFQIPSAEQADLPDSHLILLAYQKFGEACAQHLVGDFAFAIWDAANQRLFCARDHIGARPFFYFYDARIFAFASDILALLAIDGVPDEIDESTIGSYLLNQEIYYVEKHRTFRKNIFKLPFAQWLTVDRRGLRLQTYWQPENVPQVRFSSDAAYAERLSELLDTAIHDRLLTDYPVGAHSSGGIDSASIVAIANRFLRDHARDLTTYSWSPPPSPVMRATGEYRRILALDAQENLQTQFFGDRVPNPPDFDISLRREILHPERAIQKDAAQHAIRVILSGWGGDYTISFAGTGLATTLFLLGRWTTLVKTLVMPAQRRIRPAVLKGVMRQFWQEVILSSLPRPLQSRFPSYVHFRPPRESFVRSAFTARIASEVRTVPPFLARRGARRVQINFFDGGFITDRLEDWAWSGADYHIQYAYPLLDRRIMEFAYGVSAELFWKDGWKRYLFRLAVSELVPEKMAWNVLGNLKAEPGRQSMLASVKTDDIPETIFAYSALVTRNPDVPWIDTERLLAVLPDKVHLPLSDQLAIHRAVNCVRVWENWKTSNYSHQGSIARNG